MSERHVQGKTVHGGGDSFWTACSCGWEGDPRAFEDHLRVLLVKAQTERETLRQIAEGESEPWRRRNIEAVKLARDALGGYE